MTDLLKKYFAGIVSVDFTAQLETWLDKIADGKATYKKVMSGFWDVFEKELQNANLEAAKAKEENQEVSDVICEKCGAHMIVKMSRYGKYLACPNFPSCKISSLIIREKKRKRFPMWIVTSAARRWCTARGRMADI